jgi:hypothetical protein
MRTRVMSAGEKAREETRPGRETGAVPASSMAMEKEALAASAAGAGGVLSEPLLLQPVPINSAGRSRRLPSKLRGRRKFHEQVIAILS